ncbi:hypothetical protein MY11210_004515 [Beauveria gryllotalpidicola]
MAVPRLQTILFSSDGTLPQPAPGFLSSSSTMALSRLEMRFFSSLSLLSLFFAPFAALENLFFAMFAINPATPLRIFPRSGAHPGYPAGMPHLFALLVIVRIPLVVARRNREEEEAGGGPAARPLMCRVVRRSLMIFTMWLYVACYNAAVDELLREPGRAPIACLKMLAAAMMM